MRIAAAALCVLALGACSKPQEAQPTESAPAAVSAPDPWPGKYEGDLMVNVSGYPGGRRVWLIEAKADGCTGDIGVADRGVPAKDVADNAIDVVLAAKADAPSCTIHLTRSGHVVTVSEGPGCTGYHGATCSFNGRATRVK